MLIHMDIINGKIWAQRNSTEIDLGAVLTGQGVPKSDIVIGFYTTGSYLHSIFIAPS